MQALYYLLGRLGQYSSIAIVFVDIPRARKRMMEVMMKTALETPVPNIAERWAKANKKWYLTFLRSPIEFISRKDQNSVAAVKFAINRLEVRPLG